MSYIVEQVKKEDAEAMISYLKQVGSETQFLLFDEQGVPMTLEQEEQFLDNVNKTPYSRMFVVKENGQIIGNGYIHASPRFRIMHKAQIAISVLKSYWGKRIGSLIMNALIDYAKSTSFIETIYLEVATDNIAAIKLYQKFGFQIYGKNERAIKIDNYYLDWHLMRLDLNSK